MQSSNFEEVSLELEALISIYDTDLVSISNDPPRFKIKLSAQLSSQKSSEISLEFILSSSYPSSRPTVIVDPIKGVSLSNVTDINSCIDVCISDSLSCPMVFVICESVKDYMSSHLLNAHVSVVLVAFNTF